MPGRESLAQQRYYAHPRNGFWPIVSELFKLTGEDYEQKVQQLKENRVAVWDVLKACFRTGSLDSDIDKRTIVTNDFQAFYANHPKIQRVFFNGARAESIYLNQVLPGLDTTHAAISLQRMPSTSPAHAALNLAQKIEAWSALLVQERLLERPVAAIGLVPQAEPVSPSFREKYQQVRESKVK
jgi:hypoxanthine-DNA glycosylase